MSRQQRIEHLFAESIRTKQDNLHLLATPIEQAVQRLLECFKHPGKVLICGNGGSAADAQHLSSELLNRFECERRGLPAVALTCDTSTLTSIANDDRFERVFARQIEALGQAKDLLVVYSTSGHSANVVAAVQAAHACRMTVVAITGRSGGALPSLLCGDDVLLCVESASTARIQEVHLLITHCLCDLVDQALLEEESDSI